MDTGNLHVLNVTKHYDIEQNNTFDVFKMPKFRSQIYLSAIVQLLTHLT